MNVYLITDRLILREFTEDDLESLFALNGDPKVMLHLTGGIPHSPEYIRQEVLPCFLRYHAESPDFGFWAAVTKNTRSFVGYFQFRPRANHGGGIELGYRLKSTEWGKGYATELCRALIAKGFSQLGVRRVFARAMASNAASIHVLEKLGLKLEYCYTEPEFPEGSQAAVLYSIVNPLTATTERDGEITDGRDATAL
jgi:RimJ/RimL family protein N-acetyltransferase